MRIISENTREDAFSAKRITSKTHHDMSKGVIQRFEQPL
jgi:hypothetical protein